MRVLMLSWEYPPYNVGGLGKHVTELVPALLRRGIEVHLLTPRFAGGAEEATIDTTVHEVNASKPGLIPSEHDNHPNIHHVESEASRIYRVEPGPMDMTDFFTRAWQTNLRLEAKGRELIKETGNFDLIHAHDWLVAFAAGSLKQHYHLPVLSTIHATERGRGHDSLNGEMARAINNVEWWLTFESWRVIACSNYMAKEVGRFFNCPQDKIDVIPNGVDTTIFDEYEGKDLSEFRAKYAYPHEKIIFYVGRVQQEKGIQVLVDSIPRVISQYPNAKFVVAGTGSQVAELREQANNLGVGNKIYFTGFISDEDRNRLFKVADVAVFPSLYEPFGIVALEAMAAKTPVIVSATGGLTEVVKGFETGLHVYPGDVGSLTWGIVHTLQHPEWAKARAENAHKEVKEIFNWDVIAEKTEKTYERVAREARAGDWAYHRPVRVAR